MTIHRQTIGHGAVDVVFLHGLFGQGKNWTTVAKAIGEEATCHLLDMPNHGRSSWTVDFDYDEIAGYVADWLKDTFDHPVVLVGHSMGGKIAMRLALLEPELVRALMVVDISPARNASALGFTSLVAGLRSLDLDHVVSRGYADRTLRDRIPDDSVRRFLLQNLQRTEDSWHWLPNLDMLGDHLHEISGWPAIDAVYEGPVWWVVGGRSDYVQPAHHEPMRLHFPAVRVLTLKRAGHWVHAEDPEGFVQTLEAFLGTL